MKTLLLLLTFTVSILFSCRKLEEVSPTSSKKAARTGFTDNVFSYSIKNTSNESKVFRLLGNTGLADVDDNEKAGFTAGFNQFVNSVSIQSDGKIIMAGQFSSYNGVPANYIVRANTDGSIDNSFVYGSGFNNYVYKTAIQSDGKILVGGSFMGYNGTPANGIIRLNPNGSIDNSFVYGTGFSSFSGYNEVRSIVIQSDGKILIGGVFAKYNGVNTNKIIRLNSDGSIDGSFVYGTGFDNAFTNSSVLSLSVQSDGKIIAGGSFFSYNGSESAGIVRLNTNGSIDGSFIYGSGFNGPVNVTKIQSDGKIIAGGFFTSYNGSLVNNIIRLNSDGSIDGSFVSGTGFSGSGIVRDMAIESDGKILVGGQFNNYNGTPLNAIVRLNSDGSIGSSFGSGLSSIANSIAVQPDGKIIIGGEFVTYNVSNIANFIIRINSDNSIDAHGSYVEMVVNGGYITPSAVNKEIDRNSICVSEISITTQSKSAFALPIIKKKKTISGITEEERINLLYLYNSSTLPGKIEVKGITLLSCFFQGPNYLEWTVPAGETILIEIEYIQINR